MVFPFIPCGLKGALKSYNMAHIVNPKKSDDFRMKFFTRKTNLSRRCTNFLFLQGHFMQKISSIFLWKKSLSQGMRKIYRIEFRSCSFRAIMGNGEPKGHESLIKCQAVETAKYLPSTTNCLSDIWYSQGRLQTHNSSLKSWKTGRAKNEKLQLMKRYSDGSKPWNKSIHLVSNRLSQERKILVQTNLN